NRCTTLSRGGSDLDENGGSRFGGNQHVDGLEPIAKTRRRDFLLAGMRSIRAIAAERNIEILVERYCGPDIRLKSYAISDATLFAWAGVHTGTHNEIVSKKGWPLTSFHSTLRKRGIWRNR
ncbi:hypothetical protein, partial [Burkholderia ubonensis]|uniref:hypothetical protein n=1 Tax=Burkholderia ubonensis TaxID=101571 RepID=UPI001E3E5B09